MGWLSNLKGLKVEGDGKTKALVYGGAVAMVAFILVVVYLLVGRIGSGPPEVGTVVISSEGAEVAPLENEIYRTEKNVKTEKRRLVPGEIGDSAPTVGYAVTISILFDGKSDNGPFSFTIYDESESVYTPAADQFILPKEAGRYLVCEETYWGSKSDNIGMEYYFWLEVEEGDITQ